MSEINANQFQSMYTDLAIRLNELGCIMLDVEGSEIKNIISEEDLYYTIDPSKFWIKGFVAGTTPHVTLLYGLIYAGHRSFRKFVDTVLKGWDMDSIEVEKVGYFESVYKDEPYYCIVAHVKLTEELLEGHARLELLPHINTFTKYNPHVTIAYIRKDEKLRDYVVATYNTLLAGKKLTISGTNYGKIT